MRAFRVAYDGVDYRGFQRQPHRNTVENAIFDAVRALGVSDGKPDGYAAAGRTDAGVSAVQQTVALEAPDWLTPRALNSELPRDVRAWAHADVDDGFHATHDARQRAYTYHLRAPDADDALVEAAMDVLSGSHDFHNLTPDDDGTERHLDTAWRRDGRYVVCAFVSDGFPREFVRRAVSLVGAVATGERDPEFVDRVLSGEELSGPDGIPPAPPEPLVLSRVTYPDARFTVDEVAAATAREVFQSTRLQRQTGARVAGQLERGLDEG